MEKAKALFKIKDRNLIADLDDTVRRFVTRKQDVNIDVTCCEEVESIKKKLKPYLPASALRSLYMYSPMDLSQGVIMHEDCDFVESTHLKPNAYVIVTHASDAPSAGPDSPSSQLIINSGRQLCELTEGLAFRFNATKQHGLINNSTLRMLVLWFAK